MLTLLPLLVGWTTSAHAVTGLAWKLDAPVRYRLGAQVYLPQPLLLRAEDNLEARATELDVTLLTTCTVVEAIGKSAWEVSCVLDDLALGAVPVKPDTGRLAPILDEWDARLTGATVVLVFQANGRIRSLDLEGVPKNNDRTSGIHEAMRQVLRRAFAPLDFELPRKGDDKGRGEWRQGTSLAMEFPTSVGTLGSAALVHRVTDARADAVAVDSSGKGTIGSAETVAVRGTEQIRDLFEASLQGTAVFDPVHGRLVERQYLFEAKPTASSVSSQGAAGFPYVQAGRLEWIADERVITLGVTGEIDPDARSVTPR